MVKTRMQPVQLQPSGPLLQVQKLTFGYARPALLYDVSLQVQSGEMLGLLGPNGSGKTTLLRLLSGVLAPQQGQILLAGRDLRSWGRRGAARRVAVVPQELHMPFAFTVEQMVSLGRTPFQPLFLGSRKQHDQLMIQDAMAAAGVTAFAEQVFNELSGGERQRVMIAMALAQEPEILLLDEPTAHLDIKYQIETLALVQRLNQTRGMTVIAALHDLNLAARYFPRLLLFQRGIVADGSPTEVLEPALLSRVYGIDVQIGILRGAEHLSVLPPMSAQREHKQTQALVHVIAGGGSGERAMRALADAHISFIAGALNIGDSDHTLALRLAEEVITEQPFAPISPPVRTQVRTSLQQVAVLLLCPTAIGPGNLVLFQEAVTAAQNGLPIVILTETPTATACIPSESETTHNADTPNQNTTNHLLDLISQRDYTDGAGQLCIHQLIQLGAQTVTTVGAALETIKKQTTPTFH